MYHMRKKITPTWFPDEKIIVESNIATQMRAQHFDPLTEYYLFHKFSYTQPIEFWQMIISSLAIQFTDPYTTIVDLSQGTEYPHWFPSGKLNIVDSCFQANPEAIAIIGEKNITYGELHQLVHVYAFTLRKHYKRGDKLALIMTTHENSIALFLAIIKIGAIVVPIPDSFSIEEIKTRLNIVEPCALFCDYSVCRLGKNFPVYEKFSSMTFPIVVLERELLFSHKIRDQDIAWHDFFQSDLHLEKGVRSEICDPDSDALILFSSGTTTNPKAIPWTHATFLKCASDAYLHHNLKPTDIFCWPSNLGWMMGPWLIFACLLNKASLAIYPDAPLGVDFGRFIEEKRVTHLGVIPTLVKTWRETSCMENLNWKRIKLFSSTGECSDPNDMQYLMELANNKPIIEYCGGTEIGGAYLTGTVLQPAIPSAFTTPALGLNIVLTNTNGSARHKGEILIIPPSLGLSMQVLNADHHTIYFANTPLIEGTVTRRHGDQAEKWSYHHYTYYRLLGRADDTMNLGGIKVSSAEIERALLTLPSIKEVAAISHSPLRGGPSLLIIYVVFKSDYQQDIKNIKKEMQDQIKEHLNPLFKIHDIQVINALPRTVSNKIMRRVLRDNYKKK